MAKFALFVEGQTELVFIRELLLKYYDQDVKIDCFKLQKDLLEKAPYSTQIEILPDDADNYYLLINVENDEQVLGAIKKRYNKLLESNYKKIVGLRDIYSEELRNIKNSYCLDTTKDFIKRKADNIKLVVGDNEKVILCFAKMEIEAWLLAFYRNFLLLIKNPGENLQEQIEQILKESWIEGFEDIFHPTPTLIKILQLCGVEYKKKYKIVSKIMSVIQKEDFKTVFENKNVQTYNDFCKHIEVFT